MHWEHRFNHITEYSEIITRRLVERVTIFDEKIVVELKSGLKMEV